MKFVLSLAPEFFIVLLAIFIESLFNILLVLGITPKPYISTSCIALYSTVLHKCCEEFLIWYRNNLMTVVSCCFFYPDKNPDINASPQFKLINQNGLSMTTVGIHLEVRGNPRLLNYKIIIPGDKNLTNQVHKRLSKEMKSIFVISSLDNSIEINLKKLFITRQKDADVKYDFYVDVICESDSELLSSMHTGEIHPTLKHSYFHRIIGKFFLSFIKNHYLINGGNQN